MNKSFDSEAYVLVANDVGVYAFIEPFFRKFSHLLWVFSKEKNV